MPIQYFERTNPPADADYAPFSQDLVAGRLTDPRERFSGDRFVLQMPRVTMPEVEVRGLGGRTPPRYTAACHVDCSAASLRSEGAILLADYGTHLSPADVGGSLRLTQESLWHSEVYWSEYLRQDARTGWRFRLRELDLKPVEEPVALVGGPYAHHYFHWLIDVLPRIWMLRERAAPEPRRKLVVSHAWPGTFQARTLRAYGFTDEDVLPLKGGAFSFADSIYFAFNAYESLGLHPGGRVPTGGANHHKGWSPAFLDDLHGRGLTLAGPLRDGRSYERIYVTRQDAAFRHIVNEAELIGYLEARGFTVVCPGRMSLEEQIGVFQQARLIVGLHGAGLTNIVWAPRDASVIEIMPFGYDDMGYRFISGLRGMRFTVVLAEIEGDVDRASHPAMQAADCRVDLALIRQALAHQ